MAETNWNLLDTTIPARIAAIPQEAEKAQTANMLQAMQMQGLMNQNELAQSQLRTTKRAEEAQNLLGKAYAGLDFSGAGGAGAPAGQSPYAAMKAQVVKSLAGTGRADLIPSELAKIDEMQHKATVNQEVAGKVEKQARDVVDYTWKQYQSEVPKVTDAAGVERWTRAAYKDPLLGPIVSKFKPEEQAVSDALNLINQPGGLNRWIAKHMGMSADKMIDMLKTTTRTTNLNDVSRAQTEDFFGNPVGPAVDTPMGMTPGQVQAAKDALAGRQQSERHFQAGGYTYDLQAGVRYDRNGVASPLMQQAPPAGGAAVGGGVPTGRNAAGLVPVGAKPEKPTESYLKEVKGVINTNDAINNLKQMVSNFTPADMVNPARRAEIDQAHKTAVLLAKEMFNLGVLNGGDQKILEQVIPDPIAFSKGLVPIETIRKNLDSATTVVNRMNNTLSKVHKQPLLTLDAGTPNAQSPSAPPIQSFRRPD